MARLEDLPPDIFFLMLVNVPRMEVLWGFIRASPRMFAVFYGQRDVILAAFITREIGADHEIIKSLASLYVRERLYITTHGFRVVRGEEAHQRVCCYDVEDLPNTERSRLFRGFYRYMIYGNLFFYEDSRGIKYNVWSYEQCNSFLCLFPSWQVEELSYVNDFVTDKILEKWQELEEDGYNALIAADPLTWDFDKPPYQSRWKFDFFSTYEKQRWQRSYHQYFATLTLPTLLPLFKAKGDQLLQVVKDNCDGKWPHDFLSFALDEDPSWSPLIETMKDEHEQRVSTGVKIQFRRDSVGEANKAWLWAHGYQPCDLYIEPSNENPIGARLRRFGYVFWDSTRLYDTVTLK